MVNARRTRRERREVDELILERNALLDVLNAILRKVDGDLSIEHEFYLRHQRHPVEVVQSPHGIIVHLNRDNVLEGNGIRLIVVPKGVI